MCPQSEKMCVTPPPGKKSKITTWWKIREPHGIERGQQSGQKRKYEEKGCWPNFLRWCPHYWPKLFCFRYLKGGYPAKEDINMYICNAKSEVPWEMIYIYIYIVCVFVFLGGHTSWDICLKMPTEMGDICLKKGLLRRSLTNRFKFVQYKALCHEPVCFPRFCQATVVEMPQFMPYWEQCGASQPVEMQVGQHIQGKDVTTRKTPSYEYPQNLSYGIQSKNVLCEILPHRTNIF